MALEKNCNPKINGTLKLVSNDIDDWLSLSKKEINCCLLMRSFSFSTVFIYFPLEATFLELKA